MPKKKTLIRRNKNVSMRRHTSNRAYRQALADLLVLFHAVNSHHIAGRNPYTFDAVRLAEHMLFTSDRLMKEQLRWNLEEMTSQVVATNGHALLFSVPPAEWPSHMRRVVCEGNQIGMVDDDGDVVAEAQP